MNKIKVSFSHEEAIAHILLDDGRGNVLDHIMMDEIQETLKGFLHHPKLKLVMFEGAGKNFSFGASVEEHKKEFAAAMLHGFHQLFYSVMDLSVPAMAKISGQCLGGGLELALMCNFMFADQTAVLGQPEINLGVFPPPASILLPEKIGLARAEELLLTGRNINAAEAHAIGLINAVFETKEDLNRETEAWIQKYILPKSASSLRYAVKASRIKFNHVLSNFLPQLEQLYVTRLMETADANEGINSFLEKRKPVWENN